RAVGLAGSVLGAGQVRGEAARPGHRRRPDRVPHQHGRRPRRQVRALPPLPRAGRDVRVRPRPARRRRRLAMRWAWWLLAYASLALGLVGIVVPGLPTVPFVLLSAFAAARGSERLHAWLLAHPRFGPMIRDWQSQGAVSRKAKWLATVMMVLAAAIM